MSMTLPAFTHEEFQKVKLFLATQVAEMMGRKFEEGDWAKVYCAAKGIPEAPWSNLDIDIMAGELGVEQKMLCRQDSQPILETAGTTLMHPAGTRSVRIPVGISDPTEAARNVLMQYGELIDQRRTIIRTTHLYNHGRLTRTDAMEELATIGMSSAKAQQMLPTELSPVGDPDISIDMRTGWLIWQRSLKEFLYFEEKMEKPDPTQYTAIWKTREGGRRKGSSNLWVYKDGEKRFSITNQAGVKIQPYFDIPLPEDPNLYHIVVRGEGLENDLIRVWISQSTANILEKQIGSLDPSTIAAAIERAHTLHEPKDGEPPVFGNPAISVCIPFEAYELINTTFDGISGEHNFKQLVELLS